LMPCTPLGFTMPADLTFRGERVTDLIPLDFPPAPAVSIEGPGDPRAEAYWRPDRAGVALEVQADPPLAPEADYAITLSHAGLRAPDGPLVGETSYSIRTLAEGAKGTWVFSSYISEALGRIRAFELYLPPGHGMNPDQRYGTIHAYVGGLSPLEHWRTRGFVDVALEEKIAACEIEPLMFVAPDPHYLGPLFPVPGGRLFFIGGDYVDWSDGRPPTEERFETYLAREFPDFLEANYRARGNKWGRGNLGYSLAGFGAAVLAFRNPDAFGSTVPMGPFVSLRYVGGLPYRPPSVAPYWTDPTVDPLQANRLASDVVAGLRKSLGPGLANWIAHNPVEVAEGLTDADFDGNILLEVGDEDEYDLVAHAEDLSRVLTERGVRHFVRITAGGNHDWPLWRPALRSALEFHSRAFSGRPQPDSLPPLTLEPD
ncbi:MAG: esterase family protein, partial [Candidatus Methylomirabilis sp.]|nr:esterase family protein [Deltaproteobacteria bacterium]